MSTVNFVASIFAAIVVLGFIAVQIRQDDNKKRPGVFLGSTPQPQGKHFTSISNETAKNWIDWAANEADQLLNENVNALDNRVIAHDALEQHVGFDTTMVATETAVSEAERLLVHKRQRAAANKRFRRAMGSVTLSNQANQGHDRGKRPTEVPLRPAKPTFALPEGFNFTTDASVPRLTVTPEDLKAFSYLAFVDHKHKLLVVTIPKVSCTEFIRLFFRLKGKRDWRDNPHFKRGKPLLKDLPLEQVEAIWNDPTWTRAVFFRDPSERLLSAYLDKFVKNRDYSLLVFKLPRATAEGPALSYPEFVRRVANCTGDEGCALPLVRGRPPHNPQGLHSRTNAHWKPQLFTAHLFKFLPAFNFIGSFAHLEAHTKELLTRVGLWEEFGATGWGDDGREAIFQSNVAFHATGAKDVATRMKYSNPELERIIRRAYVQDYAVMERLGVLVRKRASLAEYLLHGDAISASSNKSNDILDFAVPSGGVPGLPLARPNIPCECNFRRPRPLGLGSFSMLPREIYVPEYEANPLPVLGPHWNHAEIIAGFGPGFAPEYEM